MGELIFMGIVALSALGMFAMTAGFPVSIIDKSGGPALFPRIIILLLLFFMAIRAVKILKSRVLKEQPFVFLEIFRGPRLLYLLGTLAYILLLKRVGFIIMTTAYLYGMTSYLYYVKEDGRMQRKQNIVVSAAALAVTLGIYLLFSQVLNILLPKGILKGIL